MNLYDINNEINQKLLEAIDEHGEIIDINKIDEINDLQMEKSQKCLNVAYAYKNTIANIEEIKSEIARLKLRQVVREKRAKSIKRYLEMNLKEGENYSDVRASIKWTSSSRVHVEDIEKLPKEFKRIKIEPRKISINKALKEGRDVIGCEIIKVTNFNIK